MVLLETLLYFAQFPDRQGVLSMFTNGSSSRFAEYGSLMEAISALPPARLPEVEGFVFGQSFDHVKRRIDSLTGSFLFVDFGEFHSDRTPRNSITDTQQMAATVAMKLSDAADLPEVAIATDRTLALTARLRRMLIEDASDDRLAWMEEISQQHDITPFVAPEFNSIGWTLTFTVTAADLFGVKERE